MKPKTYLLVTAGFVTVAMIAANSLQAASQQIFHNQTARVGMMTTMKLLSFRSRPASQTAATAQLITPTSPSVPLLQSDTSLESNQQFSLGNSLNRVEQITDALLTLKKLSAQGQLLSSKPMAFVLTDAQLQTAQELNWMEPAVDSLQPQTAQIQIQKLDLELQPVQNPKNPQ